MNEKEIIRDRIANLIESSVQLQQRIKKIKSIQRTNPLLARRFLHYFIDDITKIIREEDNVLSNLFVNMEMAYLETEMEKCFGPGMDKQFAQHTFVFDVEHEIGYNVIDRIYNRGHPPESSGIYE